MTFLRLRSCFLIVIISQKIIMAPSMGMNFRSKINGNDKKIGITTIFAASIGVCASVSLTETVKIAFIDPLSGAFAPSGTMGLSESTHAADYLVNSKGGVLGGQKMEIIGFDNKISPKESLIQLQVVIDQGIQYIAQGNSSGVASDLTDAVNKHN